MPEKRLNASCRAFGIRRPIRPQNQANRMVRLSRWASSNVLRYSTSRQPSGSKNLVLSAGANRNGTPLISDAPDDGV